MQILGCPKLLFKFLGAFLYSTTNYALPPFPLCFVSSHSLTRHCCIPHCSFLEVISRLRSSAACSRSGVVSAAGTRNAALRCVVSKPGCCHACLPSSFRSLLLKVFMRDVYLMLCLPPAISIPCEIIIISMAASSAWDITGF